MYKIHFLKIIIKKLSNFIILYLIYLNIIFIYSITIKIV